MTEVSASGGGTSRGSGARLRVAGEQPAIEERSTRPNEVHEVHEVRAKRMADDRPGSLARGDTIALDKFSIGLPTNGPRRCAPMGLQRSRRSCVAQAGRNADFPWATDPFTRRENGDRATGGWTTSTRCVLRGEHPEPLSPPPPPLIRSVKARGRGDEQRIILKATTAVRRQRAGSRQR